MLHARADDVLYLHGSSASRLIRRSGDREICVTATIVDGLVLARSVFHHSVNGLPDGLAEPAYVGEYRQARP